MLSFEISDGILCYSNTGILKILKINGEPIVYFGGRIRHSSKLLIKINKTSDKPVTKFNAKLRNNIETM